MSDRHSLIITTNYLNHYSLALGKELKNYFDDFYIIVNKELPDDRKKLGFQEYDNLDYVIKEWEDKEKVKELFINSDYVITDYNYNKYLKKRLELNKPVAYDTERLFKDNNIIYKYLRKIKYRKYYKNDLSSALLCISAYATNDYNEIDLFKGRTYKWGYFPEPIIYNDLTSLIKNKKHHSLIWAGRLLKWKHPEFAIEVARRLKKDNYDFSLNIIGNGEMEEYLNKLIVKYNLENDVKLLGSMSPDKVRKYMEESEIYLFTSDRGEGWGVVLNEAMNSVCACVSSYSAGSTPFMVKDGINGLVYKNDDVNELYYCVKRLFDNEKLLKKMLVDAYSTISLEWNPKIAAKRLKEFVDAILENNDISSLYKEGILSKAYETK